MGWMVLFLVLIIVLLLLVSSIKIVPQAHAYVLERLGGYKATWSVGLHFKVPILDRVARRVSLKEQMEEDRKKQVFQSIYEPFTMEHQVVYSEGLWEAVSFAGGEDCRTDNFFSMYREYFGRGN